MSSRGELSGESHGGNRKRRIGLDGELTERLTRRNSVRDSAFLRDGPWRLKVRAIEKRDISHGCGKILAPAADGYS